MPIYNIVVPTYHYSMLGSFKGSVQDAVPRGMPHEGLVDVKSVSSFDPLQLEGNALFYFL